MQHWKADCIGNTGKANLTEGEEVQLTGRRSEKYETTTVAKKDTSYDGWKLEDFHKLRTGQKGGTP